jgi:aquaporin Z
MPFAKPLTEFLGTFFLLLTILLAVADAGPMAPVAIGVALIALVYMGGAISGAHYNPAVTIAILVRGKIGPAPALGYIASQLLGAAAACAVAKALGKSGAPAPAPDTAPLAAWGAEVLFTFFLALVILNVATSKKTEGNGYFGVAIGLTVMAGAYAAGGISGGAFNPAVGVLPNLMLSADGSKHLLLYALAPTIGGVLAALVFKLQHGSEA